MSETLFGVTLPARWDFSLPIQIVQQGGISAWLVEDHSLPVVSLAWSWPGGKSNDPAGRRGLASIAAALLTEGAGDLDNIAFADALDDEGIGLSFSAEEDSFDGGLRALSDALPEAVRLARLAMARPRLDASAISRIRARALRDVRQALATPAGIASRAFWEAAFPAFAAGQHATPESVTAITDAEIRAFLATQLRQSGVMLGASGAVTAAELRALMGELFADLPEGAPAATPILPPLASFGTVRREIAAPQSTLIFGQDGLLPDDPDWEAFHVVIHILAGGGFTSRLMRRLREERGLTYGIDVGLDVLFGRGIVVGNVATENAKVGEVWGLIRSAWAEMAAKGPTEDEVADAVAFLAGSLPLLFTDSRRTASRLLGLRETGRSPEWLIGRPARLAALGRARVAAVAQRILRPDGLVLAVAGEPQGL